MTTQDKIQNLAKSIKRTGCLMGESIYSYFCNTHAQFHSGIFQYYQYKANGPTLYAFDKNSGSYVLADDKNGNILNIMRYYGDVTFGIRECDVNALEELFPQCKDAIDIIRRAFAAAKED